MREILFRGKRHDNAEWIEWTILGALFADKNIEVDFETVGQFTGLTDKNGKKIFEGDIGRYKQTDGAKMNGKPIICTGKVVYNAKTASFAVDSIDEIGAKNYDYFPIKDFEIIGNCTDNPELIGENK